MKGTDGPERLPQRQAGAKARAFVDFGKAKYDRLLAGLKNVSVLSMGMMKDGRSMLWITKLDFIKTPKEQEANRPQGIKNKVGKQN